METQDQLLPWFWRELVGKYLQNFEKFAELTSAHKVTTVYKIILKTL